MPSKRQTGPTGYLPIPEPVWAMRVQKPYKAVAEWCGGEIVTNGPRFAFIALRSGEFGHRAAEGDYIVQQPDGSFARRPAADFEKHYQRSIPQPKHPTEKE